MKKIITLALLLSSISFVTFAQQTSKKENRADRKRTELVDKTAEEIAKRRTDHIDKEVNLTAKQRKDVYAFYFNEAKAKIEAEEKASRNAGGVDNRAKKESKDGVHKLLTPEQQTVLADKKGKGPGQNKAGKGKESKKKIKSSETTQNK